MCNRSAHVLLTLEPYTAARPCRYDVQKPNSRLKAEVEAVFEESTAAWVLQDMADNRDKERLKVKRYDLNEAVTALRAGAPLQTHWGSKKLLHRLQERPDLLCLDGAAIEQ